VIVRGQFNSKLFKGELDRIFWQGYNAFPTTYQKIFHKETDDQAEVTQLGMVGFGGVHVRYGLGMRVTHEVLSDMKYPQTAKAVTLFGRSAVIVEEAVTVAIFNNAFNTSYPWHPDVGAIPLISAAHVLADGVNTTSNLLGTAADLDVTPLGLMTTLLESQQVDPIGVGTPYTVRNLIVAPANKYLAMELLRSSDRPDTAERATNVLKGIANLVVWNGLTDADAWFMDSADNELYFYTREALDTDVETIAQTGGKRGDKFYFADERFSTLIADFHGIVGTPGAG
jgi:hypothetical protein